MSALFDVHSLFYPMDRLVYTQSTISRAARNLKGATNDVERVVVNIDSLWAGDVVGHWTLQPFHGSNHPLLLYHG